MSTICRRITDEATKAQFKQSFGAHILRCTSHDSSALYSFSDQQLCELYEKCPISNKRGIWSSVGEEIGMTSNWCRKYYINTFKGNLYTESLTEQDKTMIVNKIVQLIDQGVDKTEIVTQCKNMMAFKNVFPNKVISFAYQFYDTYTRKYQFGPRRCLPKRNSAPREAKPDTCLSDIFDFDPHVHESFDQTEANNMRRSLENILKEEKAYALNDNEQAESKIANPTFEQLLSDLYKVL